MDTSGDEPNTIGGNDSGLSEGNTTLESTSLGEMTFSHPINF